MIIKNWIFNIVSIVMAGTLLDIALPNGSLKKYSKFILGLITLIVIINPVLTILNQIPNLEKKIASNIFSIDMKSSEYQSKVITETQQYQLKNMLEKNISNHISQEVEKITGYSKITAKVELDQTNMHDEGSIKGIYLEIGLNNKTIDSVKPIDVYVNISEDKTIEPEDITESAKTEQEKIINHISDVYEIEPSKIHITWLDG